MKRKILILAIGFVVLTAGYMTFVVIQNRAATPQIIQNAKAKITELVTKDDLTGNRLAQLLKIQDQNFFTHHGTDLFSGRVTTITQSLTKFLYFEKFKPGIAKIKQSLIARYALDPLVSKDDQLYLFLNLSYFGNFQGKEVRGFGEASKTYFQKPLRDLSEQEYLSLLAMLSGPNEYHVRLQPQKNAEQVALIQSKLHL